MLLDVMVPLIRMVKVISDGGGGVTLLLCHSPLFACRSSSSLYTSPFIASPSSVCDLSSSAPLHSLPCHSLSLSFISSSITLSPLLPTCPLPPSSAVLSSLHLLPFALHHSSALFSPLLLSLLPHSLSLLSTSSSSFFCSSLYLLLISSLLYIPHQFLFNISLPDFSFS